jgi:HSP20 family protein
MNNLTTTTKQPAETEVSATNRYTFTPKCDIWETADAVYLEAELPGVDEQGVDVKLEDGVLSLLGRVTPETYTGLQRTYAEYEPGSFERSFRISDAVDEERISATLRNGLLRIELPKREAVKPRRIQVATA